MNSKEILKSSLGLTNMVLHSYLGDMDDSDLMKRPGIGCNHIAWQLGHLIASNTNILNMVAPGMAPELPTGFAEKHSNESKNCNEAAQFYSKQQYMDLMKKLDDALIAAIDQASEADLDKPSPESFRSWCPRLGDIFVLLVSHPLMHAGQWVPVRRMLEKPVVM
jgi:hypothetical protein